MADIAELGWVADSSDIRRSTKDLDKLTPSTAKAEKATDRINDQFDRGRKSATMYDRALGGVNKGISALAAGVAGGVAGFLAGLSFDMLFRGLMGVADQIEHMSNVAAAAGGTVGGVQILTIAMNAAGVESGELERSAKNLNRTLGDVALGGAKQAADALKRLGLDAGTLSRMDIDQRFTAISNALSGLNLTATESAALLDNLGIKSTNLIAVLTNGGDSISAVRDQIDKLGLSLTQVDQDNLAALDASFDQLGITGQAAGTKIAAVFAPLVTLAIDAANASIAYFAEKFGAIYALAEGLYNLSADTLFGTVKPLAQSEDELVERMRKEWQLTKVETEIANIRNSMNGLSDTFLSLEVAATGVTPSIEDIEKKAALFDETTSALTPTIESLASGFDTLGQSATTAAGGAGGGSGLSAVNDALQSTMDYAEQTRQTFYDLKTEIAGEVTSAVKGFFTDLRQGVGIVDAFGNAVGRLADRLLDMVLDGALQSIIGSFFGLGTIAGGAPIPSGGFIPGITGPKLFAKGGVFGGPTAFDTGSGLGVAGEAGPEAILPLHRAANGGLGVAMAANDNYQGSPIMLNVRIINNASNDTEVSAEMADDGSLEVTIDRLVAKNLSDSGSRTNKAMQSSFGVRNTTVSR